MTVAYSWPAYSDPALAHNSTRVSRRAIPALAYHRRIVAASPERAGSTRRDRPNSESKPPCRARDSISADPSLPLTRSHSLRTTNVAIAILRLITYTRDTRDYARFVSLSLILPRHFHSARPLDRTREKLERWAIGRIRARDSRTREPSEGLRFSLRVASSDSGGRIYRARRNRARRGRGRSTFSKRMPLLVERSRGEDRTRTERSFLAVARSRRGCAKKPGRRRYAPAVEPYRAPRRWYAKCRPVRRPVVGQPAASPIQASVRKAPFPGLSDRRASHRRHLRSALGVGSSQAFPYSR